jgi:hypothetical protein
LPDFAQLSPGLRLDVPETQVSLVSERVAATARARRWAAPDSASVDAAVARAFVTWRLDASCLPRCGTYRLTNQLIRQVELTIASPPLWKLYYWIIPVARSR